MNEILDELPKDFAEKIQNVEFIVEDEADSALRKKMKLSATDTLLGLYQGVPLPHRSPTWYAGVLPDRIVIFKKPIEQMVSPKRDLRSILKRTILHEIAHYFGISDKRLRQINAY